VPWRGKQKKREDQNNKKTLGKGVFWGGGRAPTFSLSGTGMDPENPMKRKPPGGVSTFTATTEGGLGKRIKVAQLGKRVKGGRSPGFPCVFDQKTREQKRETQKE